MIFKNVWFSPDDYYYKFKVRLLQTQLSHVRVLVSHTGTSIVVQDAALNAFRTVSKDFGAVKH